MPTLGPQELFFLFLIVLLIFGGRKIPEIARGLGKGMREFRKGMRDIQDDFENSDDTGDKGKAESSSSREQDGKNP